MGRRRDLINKNRETRVNLWVPERRHTAGDLLIFMEEPAEVVASFDLGISVVARGSGREGAA
jgi:hypothetical protein